MDRSKEYKVNEFRKNLRAALDIATAGHDIYIVRGPLRYRLYLDEVTFNERSGLPVAPDAYAEPNTETVTLQVPRIRPEAVVKPLFRNKSKNKL